MTTPPILVMAGTPPAAVAGRPCKNHGDGPLLETGCQRLEQSVGGGSNGFNFVRMREGEGAVQVDQQVPVRGSHEHGRRAQRRSFSSLFDPQHRAAAEDFGKLEGCLSGSMLNDDDGGREVPWQGSENVAQRLHAARRSRQCHYFER